MRFLSAFAIFLGFSTALPLSAETLAEALNVPRAVIAQSNASYPWRAQSTSSMDGWAAQSGAIGHNGSTAMSFTADGPGQMSFYWSVSSESGCDPLIFSVDGTEVTRISGSVGWTQYVYDLPAGRHVLRWTYSKDGSVNTGSDCGWVDQVVLPISREVTENHLAVTNGAVVSVYSRTNGIARLEWVDEASAGVFSVPAQVNGLAVTEIAPGACAGCTNLTSIVLGSAITNLPARCFAGCTRLTGVALPKTMNVIPSGLFDGCSALARVDFPPTVATIGPNAFRDCASLTELDMPKGVKLIAGGAFIRCSGIRELTLPEALQNIDSSAFAGCSNLVQLAFPEGLRIIRDGAFLGCCALQDIHVPKSVMTIGASAFGGCASVTNMVLPFVGAQRGNRDSAQAEFGHVFGAVSLLGMESVSQSYGSYYIPTSLVHVAITDEQVLGTGCFRNCLRLREVEIPDTVTNRAFGVFNGCSSLTSLHLPLVGENANSALGSWFRTSSVSGSSNASYVPASLKHVAVSRIGFDAFRNCPNLESVDISSPAVTNMPDSVFQGCSALTNVLLSTGVRAVGAAAFDGCTALSAVNLPAGVNALGAGAFRGCQSLQEIAIGPEVTEIADEAFMNCTSLVVVAGCEGVTSIGARAFRNDAALTQITFPETLERIGEEAFAGCSSLLPPPLPLSVKDLGARAFQGTRVEGILMPEGLTSIVPYAYRDTTNLTQLVVPPGVTNIGAGAFQNCRDLESLTLPAGLVLIDASAFEGCSALKEIRVPESVTVIGASAFAGCTSVTNMVLPFVGNVRGNANASSAVFGYVFGTRNYDGTQAAHQNYGTYYIPTSLVHVAITDERNLGSGCFWNCPMLKEVEISDTVATRTFGTFNGCGNIERLRIPMVGETSTSPLGTWFQTSSHAGSSNASYVPSSLKHVAVCRVGYDAFQNCPNLLSVDISAASVTNLPASAFQNCAALTNVLLPAELRSVGDHAFYGCGSLRGLEIPAGVEMIGAYAFSGCSSLARFEVPELVRVLPNGVFESCSQMTNVTYGGIVSIGASAFRGCSSLQDLDLPTTLTNIQAEAFWGCTNFAVVTIPKSVEEIGFAAFSGCHGIQKMEIPFVGRRRGLSEGGDAVFGHVFGTTSYSRSRAVYQNSTRYYIPTDLRQVIVTDAPSLGHSAFEGCADLTDIALDDGVSVIGPWAFSGCANIRTFALPEAVKDIPKSAFYGCSSLERISFAADLESVGDYAFSGCRSLEMAGLPDSVRMVGNQAFYGTSGVTEITIPAGTTQIAANQYRNMGGVVRLVIPEGVTSIGERAFAGCSNLTEVVFPTSLSRLEYGAFETCVSLGDVTVPTNVVEMGQGVFGGCASLTNMVLPFVGSRRGGWEGADTPFGWIFGTTSFKGCDKVRQYYSSSSWNSSSYYDSYIPASLKSVVITDETTVQACAFGKCTKLERIEFRQGEHEIGPYAFGDCTGLKEIVLSKATTAIRANAFLNCSALEKIVVPVSVTSIEADALKGCSSLAHAVLPFVGRRRGDSPAFLGQVFGTGSVVQRDAYGLSASYGIPTGLVSVVVLDETRIGSGAFAGCAGLQQVELPACVTNLAPAAFRDCASLRRFTVPAGVTVLASNVFESCTSLEAVQLPKDLRSIGSRAFRNCATLAAVEVPEGVTEIGFEAFAGCRALGRLVLPSTLVSIGRDAFAGCASLADVTLPAGVTSVPENLFRGCADLVRITLGDGVTALGENAFADCSNLVSVTLPQGVRTIGPRAFANCTALPEIVLPPGLSEIAFAAFATNASLRRIVVPEGVTNIAEQAFAGCTQAGELVLPQTLDTIGASAFAGCASVAALNLPTNLTVVGNWAFEGMARVDNLVVPDSMQEIGIGAFSGFSALTNMVTPFAGRHLGVTNGVAECMAAVFGDRPYGASYATTEYGVTLKIFVDYYRKYYTNETYVTANYYVPRKLRRVVLGRETSLPTSAFEGWMGLLAVELPETLTWIGRRAFYGCRQLERIVLPAGLLGIVTGDVRNYTTYSSYSEHVDGMVFGGDCALRSITLPGHVIALRDLVSTYAQLEEVVVQPGTPYIGFGFMEKCAEAKRVVIPEGVASIETAAFEDCTSLVEVKLPETVRKIEHISFLRCTALSRLEFPTNLVSIGINAFNGCTALEAVELPDSVETIASSAFCGCTALREVTLGRGLSELEGNTFADCTGLRSVVFLGDAPWLEELNIYAGASPDLLTYVAPGTTGWTGDWYSDALPASGTWPISLTDARRIARLGTEPGEDIPGEDGPGVPGGDVPGSDVPGGVAEGALPGLSAGTATNMTLSVYAGYAAHGLPAGMTWDPVTGTLGGSATESGTFDIFFVKDGQVRRHALTVSAPAAPFAAYDLVAGVETNLVIGGVAGCDAYALPAGLGWDKARGALVGAALNPGTNTVYFARGYGEATETFSTVLRIAAAPKREDVPGTDVPGADTPGTNVPGMDKPDRPSGPGVEDPGVEDPGTEDPAAKDVVALSVSVVCEGGAKGTATPSAVKIPRGASTILSARVGNANSLFAFWRTADGSIVGLLPKLQVSPTEDVAYEAVFRAKAACAEPSFPADALASVATQAMCGVQFRTRVSVDPAAYPVRFTAQKLPPGLRIDAKTGEIQGVPIRAGDFVATVKATSRANVSRNSRVAVRISVAPLPSWAIGTFGGALEGMDDAGDLRGTATLTASVRGRLSGSFVELGTNYAFHVNGYDVSSRFTDGVTNLVVAATARRNGVTRPVRAAGGPPAGVEPSQFAGTVGDGAAIWFARSPWKDAAYVEKLAPFKGLYTVQLVSDGSCGHGYLSLTVDAAGTAKAAGKLGDGTAVSATLPLFWDAAAEAPYAVFSVAPAAYAGGFVHEVLRFDADRRIAGEGGLWVNRAPTATMEYGEGFAYPLTSVGAWYNSLADLRDYYSSLAFRAEAPDLAVAVKVTDADENGKSVTTTESEWQGAVDLLCWDALTVDLDAKGTAFIVPKATTPVQDKATKEWSYDGANDAALAFSFTKTTGIFKGSFTCWYDYVSAYDYVKETETAAHVSKKVSFEGIAVQGVDTLRGAYLWEGSGTYVDPKTGKDVTYKVNESHAVEFERRD